MKLMIIGSWQRTTLQEVGGRFASGEHAIPPEPCALITRWHDPSSKRFWLVVDTPDAKIIQEWLSRWTDIIDWETFTVLDDQEVGEMLSRLLQSYQDCLNGVLADNTPLPLSEQVTDRFKHHHRGSLVGQQKAQLTLW